MTEQAAGDGLTGACTCSLPSFNTALPVLRCTAMLSCSDVSDSEGEEEEGGSELGDEMAASEDESLPELEPNVDALRDADTGTEFGMEVWSSQRLQLGWSLCHAELLV